MIRTITIEFNSGNVYIIEPMGTRFILTQEERILGQFDSVNKAIDKAMELR